MRSKTRPSYEFGPFRLDPAERLLLRDGEPVPLTPKAFEVLVLLIEEGGRLVGKKELMNRLWPDSFVQEANLTNTVYAVRKALGGEQGERYVENVPKHGYRFVAEVRSTPEALQEVLVVEKHTLTRTVTEEELLPGGGESHPLKAHAPVLLAASEPGRVGWSRPLALVVLCALTIGALTAFYRPWSRDTTRQTAAEAAGAARKPRTIAVLPFKFIGTGKGGAGEEHLDLGLGMTDALITRLGHGRQIVVRPTSAVRRYSGPQQDPVAAGREQGVEAVLDGSVQLSGDRIRVTVQLLSIASGDSIWAGQFDERFTDIFAVQDSISQQVMQKLLVELNAEERQRLQLRGTENIEAYQAYLKGHYFWNKRSKDGYKKAVGYFNRAIELDAAYARAYVGLGNAYAFMGGHDPVSHGAAIAKQRAAVKKALELDETLAEAHASLGLIAMNSDSDWFNAEKEFKRAIELNPNHPTAHQWYGEFLADMGRFDEGIAEVERAQELDPLSLIINTDVAKVYTLARRYDEAIVQYKRALEMDPEFEVAHGLLGLTYSLKGQHEEALGELRKIRSLDSDPIYQSILGFAYARAGKIDEARAVLQRLSALSKRTYVSPFWSTIVYSGLGESDQAFKLFERLFKEKNTDEMIALKVSPVFDNLRSDPRFPELLRRAGF